MALGLAQKTLNTIKNYLPSPAVQKESLGRAEKGRGTWWELGRQKGGSEGRETTQEAADSRPSGSLDESQLRNTWASFHWPTRTQVRHTKNVPKPVLTQENTMHAAAVWNTKCSQGRLSLHPTDQTGLFWSSANNAFHGRHSHLPGLAKNWVMVTNLPWKSPVPTVKLFSEREGISHRQKAGTYSRHPLLGETEARILE